MGLILLACYMYRMKSALDKIKLIKEATRKPISGLRLVLSRMFPRLWKSKWSPPATSPGGPSIETQTDTEEIHPTRITKILRDVFQTEQTASQVRRTLGQEIPVRAGHPCGATDQGREDPWTSYSRDHYLGFRFVKLTQDAITPCWATLGSVGYDLFSPIDFVLRPKEQSTVFTDIAV